MWSWILIVVIGLHGLIHLMGFAVYLRLANIEGLSYPTSFMGGALGAPPILVRFLGILWLVAALAVAGAAAALFLTAPYWRAMTLAAAIGSLVLCVLAWPDAKAGVFVNIGLLAIVLGLSSGSWP